MKNVWLYKDRDLKTWICIIWGGFMSDNNTFWQPIMYRLHDIGKIAVLIDFYRYLVNCIPLVVKM